MAPSLTPTGFACEISLDPIDNNQGIDYDLTGAFLPPVTRITTMLEFDVTPLFADKLDAYLLSNSVANLGDRAGQITWENALEAATDYPLVTDENREEVQDWIKEFGAWDEAEILLWDSQTLSAFIWQSAAADFREHWEDYISDFNETDWASIEIPESQIFIHDGKFLFQAC